MTILSVVESAYRATLEEQDDTVLWLNHMIKNAGGSINLLLRSNAVNYAAKGQNAEGLVIGGVPLSMPPTIEKDVVDMVEKGMTVYVVEEDLKDLGIGTGDLVSGVTLVKRSAVAGLFDQHDAIWYW